MKQLRVTGRINRWQWLVGATAVGCAAILLTTAAQAQGQCMRGGGGGAGGGSGMMARMGRGGGGGAGMTGGGGGMMQMAQMGQRMQQQRQMQQMRQQQAMFSIMMQRQRMQQMQLARQQQQLQTQNGETNTTGSNAAVQTPQQPMTLQQYRLAVAEQRRQQIRARRDAFLKRQAELKERRKNKATTVAAQ